MANIVKINNFAVCLKQIQNIMKKLVLIIMPLLILASCQNNKKVEGLNREDMDLSVAPGDNFYQYADGVYISLYSG